MNSRTMLRFVGTKSTGLHAHVAVPSRQRLTGSRSTTCSRAAIAASGASAVLLYRYSSDGSSARRNNNRLLRPDFPTLAEAPRSNDGNDDGSKPKAAATGWVDNVTKDGLAKFLNDFILADDEKETNDKGERSKSPPPKPSTDGDSIFDRIRDELKDAVDDIAGRLPKAGGPESSSSSAAEQTDKQQKVSTGDLPP